jgi:hydrogenase/urease accessory protein HupE
MERRKMKRIVVSGLVLGGTATAAFAHPGDHALPVLNSLSHLVTEPDHVAMLVGAAAVAFVLLRMLRARKA